MNEVEEPVLKLEEQREQLDRVLRSNVFKSAHALRKFLEYVGSKALAGFSAEVKEYAIGTEVFGRPANQLSRRRSRCGHPRSSHPANLCRKPILLPLSVKSL
ncbi:MAG: hypothetical protein DMG60_22850 [Acidobacteria bacterium]|nr:MAG: hypothetical protein DMG60_22850 [Acidobacteriota bacterium]